MSARSTINSIPIVRNLTFSQSASWGRYVYYSDAGGAFSPRVALRYQPVSALTMYGSFNRGYRSPTFVEDANSSALGLQTNPDTGALETTVVKGNSDLQPEHTKNFNLGFELSPTRTTGVGFDWYRIIINNVVGENLNAAQAVTDPTTGQVLYESLQYENLGSLDTSGFDMNGFEATFRQALPTKIGTFTLTADWAYVASFWLSQNGTSVIGAGMSRVHATFRLSRKARVCFLSKFASSST
jgi:iron complex outermembrane receptor protein